MLVCPLEIYICNNFICLNEGHGETFLVVSFLYLNIHILLRPLSSSDFPEHWIHSGGNGAKNDYVLRQDTPGSVPSLNENISRRADIKCCQHEGELMKVPMEPIKGLWDYPNKLSEEMVRCMKNIFISLADSALPCQSFTSQTSHLLPISPNGHLSNSISSWWSSSDRSLISSWVQSPVVDVQSNLEVLAMENICDPYRVRGKLSWADVGNYGLAIEVSWMSVGKKQLEYAAGALRSFRLNFYSLDL